MCGFAGLFSPSFQSTSFDFEKSLHAMTQALRHRGPNDEGFWTDLDSGVGLGFRRLAILDLAPTGHQPMASHCGRYEIIFNGEIYNYRDLKSELQANGYTRPFLGSSDTEVLLASFSHWGIQKTLTKLNGMFAIALWDRETKTLTLSRDPIGEKPLYYGIQKGALLFGSELKALKAFPGFAAEIDRTALSLHFRYSCIPSPYSIYQGISKLPPGTFLTVKGDLKNLTPVPYWSALSVVETGTRNRFKGSFDDASRDLEALLEDSVRRRLQSDVPLGAFLSGGIDSSLVVALMQKVSSAPVSTFTIGFDEKKSDESGFAKLVAKHLGTHHTEQMISPREAMDVIPDLPSMYDEPFADASGIPTYLVSKLARSRVTVALAGDGGDELFGGYNRYLWGEAFWKRVGWVPGSVRALVAQVLAHLPQPLAFRRSVLGERLMRVAEVLPEKSPEALYRALRSHFHPPSQVLNGQSEGRTAIEDPSMEPQGLHYLEKMFFYDLVTYLPDDVLAKLDRASMSVSLEGRLPILDPRVVEFAWTLPLEFKIQGGESKRILKDILYRHVPRELVDRPKMGFSVPTGAWLRGGLRDWAESLLNEKTLREDGFLRVEEVEKKWREHLQGSRNWQHHLWDILSFQAWLHQQ